MPNGWYMLCHLSLTTSLPSRNYYYPHISEVSSSDPISHCLPNPGPRGTPCHGQASCVLGLFSEHVLHLLALTETREHHFLQPCWWKVHVPPDFALLCCFWVISSSFSFKDPLETPLEITLLDYTATPLLCEPLVTLSFIKAVNTWHIFFIILLLSPFFVTSMSRWIILRTS